MAIVCPQCGAQYDFTLFQFGRGVSCDCGAWVDLSTGNREESQSGGESRPRWVDDGQNEDPSPKPDD